MKTFFVKNPKTIITTLVLLVMLAVPMLTFMPLTASADLASDINNHLVNTGLGDELGDEDLPQAIGNVITVVLGFLGVVFILFILYAGFIWLTANGDDGKIKKAKGIMVNSIIAVIIIFLAFAITQFVFGTIIGQGVLNES